MSWGKEQARNWEVPGPLRTQNKHFEESRHIHHPWPEEAAATNCTLILLSICQKIQISPDKAKMGSSHFNLMERNAKFMIFSQVLLDIEL